MTITAEGHHRATSFTTSSPDRVTSAPRSATHAGHADAMSLAVRQSRPCRTCDRPTSLAGCTGCYEHERLCRCVPAVRIHGRPGVRGHVMVLVLRLLGWPRFPL